MDWKTLLSQALHGLASAVHTVASSSALDADTRKSIQEHVDKAREAAGALAESGFSAVEESVEAAPAAAGAFAGAATGEAVSKAPGVGVVAAPVLASVVQAAVTLALGHWIGSLEAHNGDHIAAAKSAIDKLANGDAPDEKTKTAVLATVPPQGFAALDTTDAERRLETVQDAASRGRITDA